MGGELNQRGREVGVRLAEDAVDQLDDVVTPVDESHARYYPCARPEDAATPRGIGHITLPRWLSCPAYAWITQPTRMGVRRRGRQVTRVARWSRVRRRSSGVPQGMATKSVAPMDSRRRSCAVTEASSPTIDTS